MDDVAGKLQSALADSLEIERELTGGGMSRVFVARDIALGRRVVIKVLPPELAQAVSADRFRREIMVSAALQHPNIVPVLSAGQVGDLPYFIMPFVEGESLRARLARGPLSIREAVGVLRDVARALSYAHGRGIIHRDIKPDNVLLSGGASVVTDFGVAKAISVARHRQDAARPNVSRRSITNVGTSLGTPAYMAPEQAAADPTIDHRADLYALGVVGYELLVGTPPFHGRAPQALLAAQLTERPAPITSRRYDVPPVVADLLMKCLEKDPNARPKTAADVLRVLENPAVISGAFDAPLQTRERPSWKRSARFAAAAAVAALLLFTGYRLVSPTPRPAAGSVPGTAPRVVVVPIEFAPGDTLAAAVAGGIRSNVVRLLSQIPAIQVATQTSPPDDSSPGPGPRAAAQQAQRLEGAVQRSGKRLRITFRLVGIGDNVATWSEMYERTLTDPFATQDDVAKVVVEAVAARLGAFPARPDSSRK